MNYSQNTVMVRVHEIALKGKNRPIFFSQLQRNLKQALQGMAVSEIRQRHMGIEITLAREASWDKVSDRIKQVFGVVTFYRCYKMTPCMKTIEEFLRNELPKLNFKTFRITAKRGDKNFPLTSPEINRQLGSFVETLTGAKVMLVEPEVNIFVELMPREALIYFQKKTGPGGLPVGVSGKVAALLSGGIDSPVAAWRMMKRGCQVTLIHFHSFPLVDGSSREKAVELAEVLNLYQFHTSLFLVPFAEVQRDIILSVPPVYRIIIYRRFMARIAERIAQSQGAQALVTGESLGQVGSQTLENLVTIRNTVDIPIFSPLIGMDKQEIISAAREIGTYHISILPDEDCCTLFVPRHPATRSTHEEIERIEYNLDIPGLVEKAASQAQVTHFKQQITS